MTTFASYNPATGERVGHHFGSCLPEDVDRRVSMVRLGQKAWSKKSKIERADMFAKLVSLTETHSDKLALIISQETGKTFNEAMAEVVESIHMLQVVAARGREPVGQIHASELEEKQIKVLRKPKGVVAVISAWNFPLAIGSAWCAGPALVEGNTVIHKPSELTLRTAEYMKDLYRAAGFGSDVYQVIRGDSSVGAALVNCDVDHVMFTGSREVGQKIAVQCAKSKYPKTCGLELGSKSATMVFDSADLDMAVDACFSSAFKLSGQRCVSSGRLLVQRSILDKFISKFIAKASNAKVGWAERSSEFDFGPVITKDQAKRINYYNNLVRGDSNAKILLDKEIVDLHHPTLLGPFVYTCEWGNERYLKEEVFGPHVAIIPFDDVDDAIRIYNDTEYGLALGAFTNDFRVHKRLEEECTTGMLYINGGSIAAESHVPFSSWKVSGYGSSAAGAFDSVTHTTTVTTNYGKTMRFAQGMK